MCMYMCVVSIYMYVFINFLEKFMIFVRFIFFVNSLGYSRVKEMKGCLMLVGKIYKVIIYLWRNEN